MDRCELFTKQLQSEVVSTAKLVKSENALANHLKEIQSKCWRKLNAHQSNLERQQKKINLEMQHIRSDKEERDSLEEELNVKLIRNKKKIRDLTKAMKKKDKKLVSHSIMTQNDNMILFKRRFSVYLIKSVFGIHLQDLPNELTTYSWNKENCKANIIAVTFSKSKDQKTDYKEEIWNIISKKSQYQDQWTQLFKKAIK